MAEIQADFTFQPDHRMPSHFSGGLHTPEQFSLSRPCHLRDLNGWLRIPRALDGE
jgi:hypothetical protein